MESTQSATFQIISCSIEMSCYDTNYCIIFFIIPFVTETKLLRPSRAKQGRTSIYICDKVEHICKRTLEIARKIVLNTMLIRSFTE